jgi:hypothetical protein
MRVRARIQRVREFRTIKEAKDCLAERIATEAERGGVPLSDVERKMLYFSETGWTLPDTRVVSQQCDRDCVADEYEQKIARLVRNIEAWNHAQNPETGEVWEDVVLKLSEGDHYLSVLITSAREDRTAPPGFIPALSAPTVRPPHDRLKLWLTAFAVVFGILVSLYIWISGR